MDEEIERLVVSVPTSSGWVDPSTGSGQGRDIRVSININAPGETAPQALAASSRQVARAVRSALMRFED